MNIDAPVITIDGPSGSGKGTLCQRLADYLHWPSLDSGLIYRALAARALGKNIDLSDGDALAQLASDLEIKDHKNLRTETCGAAASKISAIPQVRQALLNRQRDFRRLPGLVTDGRDMGTVVFPDALVKIYLEASAQARALRRYNQLKAQGVEIELTQIEADISARDQRDKVRTTAPLKPAVDAVIIDTTDIPIEEVLALVVDCARNKGII